MDSTPFVTLETSVIAEQNHFLRGQSGPLNSDGLTIATFLIVSCESDPRMRTTTFSSLDVALRFVLFHLNNNTYTGTAGKPTCLGTALMCDLRCQLRAASGFAL